MLTSVLVIGDPRSDPAERSVSSYGSANRKHGGIGGLAGGKDGEAAIFAGGLGAPLPAWAKLA